MSKSIRLESSIERASVNKAKARGWSSQKNLSRFERSKPDRLFWKDGRYVWIEYKRPGNKLTKAQDLRLNRLQREGCFVAVCTSVQQTMEVLDMVEMLVPPIVGRNLTFDE